MRARTWGILLVAVILTGCTAPEVEPSGAPTVSPEPTTVLRERPASVFDAECVDLLDADVLARLYGVPLESAILEPSLIDPATSATVAQAGGLACEWRHPGELEPVVVLAALPSATAAFAAQSAIAMEDDGIPYGSDYHSADVFDGLVVRCEGHPEYDYLAPLCQWIALSGDVGISLWMSRVSPSVVVDVAPPPNPDTSLPGVVPVIEGSDSVALLEGAFAVLDREPRRELQPLPAAGPGCETGLTAAEVAGALGVSAAAAPTPAPPAFDRGYEAFGQVGGWVTTAAAIEVGLVRCTASVDTAGVTAWSMPGMAWLVAGKADRPAADGFGPIAGLGRDGVLVCVSGEDAEVCRVTFVVGSELRGVELRDGGKAVDPQAAIELAAVAFD